jgi:Ca-activated chloride channel homolog
MKNNRKNSWVTGKIVMVFPVILLVFYGCTQYGPEEKEIADSASHFVSMEKLAEEPAEDVIGEHFNTEEYSRIYENAFKDPKHDPLSTFSIDVDNASYSNVRRFIDQNTLPPPDAVRIEEMINYFDYDYPQPAGEQPFSLVTEVSECPWNKKNRLIHIGIQGKKLDYENLKPGNYVFLLDVSGSMDGANRLPLVKKSMKMLLGQLGEKDRIAIVTYAGKAGLVLPSTPASKAGKIEDALERLEPGGSTAGGEGIALAYKIAKENYIEGGNNRVILCTDGDFNVGVSSTGELVRMAEEKQSEDIYLTICGFGMGNYKDGRMEEISKAGNGNYFYIDNIQEAKKVFVKEMRANLFAIAKDVKIQVEFNPAVVKSYRLVGYENRILKKEDFNDDKKDAGELGAGHTVTALYEIALQGGDGRKPAVDPLKYQETKVKEASSSTDLLTLKLRYKPISSDKSLLIEKEVSDNKSSLAESSADFRFSAAVAGFGMLLRGSEYKGDLTYTQVASLAKEAIRGKDDEYKQEFVQLVERAELLK